MVDYEAEDWVGVLFKARGSVLPRLFVRVGIAAVLGGVSVALFQLTDFHVPPVAHGLIGVALGLLLVFRTNASYDRFWEGRRLVGKLVIALTTEEMLSTPQPGVARARNSGFSALRRAPAGHQTTANARHRTA